jgi:hypothetical protein
MDNPIKIVVLQRGWVLIGRYSRQGAHCQITQGAVLRRWGTKLGLGQLALEGPTDATKLDPAPLADWHELTEIFTLGVDQSKWESVIAALPMLPVAP